MENISNGLGFGGSSDPKAAVMNQVRQEAAMTNARQLIEVCLLRLLVPCKANANANANA
jgi:hypothetical protein